MKHKKIIIIASSLLLVIFTLFLFTPKKKEKITLTIAIPYEEQFAHINSRYYKTWLEEQTDFILNFEFIPEYYIGEYLNILLSTDTPKIDVILFSPQTAPTSEEVSVLGTNEKLLILNEWIETDSIYLNSHFKSFEDYDLEQSITASDGNIYYMPSVSSSNLGYHLQKLYINISWLEELGLAIPITTEDFKNVLIGFAEGKSEALPIIGSADDESTFILNFLLNSFVQCNPTNHYISSENDVVFFSPITTQWRKGLVYCRELYHEGLIVPQNFSFSTNQLTAIANDPRDLVGGFVSNEISDVLSENSSDLLSEFLFISPLTSSDNIQYSTPVTKLPTVGGVVISKTKYPNESLELLDLMLSEDAFLAGHYGERNIDWEYSKTGNFSTSGEPAVITIINQDWLHDKKISLSSFGPFMTDSDYADGIMWKRFQTNQTEYFEARASKVYQQSNPSKLLMPIALCQSYGEYEEHFNIISQYTKTSMIDFVTGKLDINSDDDWNEYIAGFEEIKLSYVMKMVESHYRGKDRCNEKK